MTEAESIILEVNQLLETGDILSLLIGGLLLMVVAQHAGKTNATVQLCGTRIGVLAFVGWYIRDIGVNGLYDASQFVTTGIRALLVLLYTTNIAWLVLAIGHTAFLSDGRCGLFQFFRRRRASAASNTPVTSVTYPESRNVDSSASAEEEAQLQEEAENLVKEQRERDAIRFNLEILYDRYRHELKDLLPPEHFAEYFATRLTNELPVETYRIRAEQVTEMIRDRLQLADEDTPDWQSSEEIITEFNTRIKRLQYHDLDEDTLETLQLQLNEERNAALRKHFTEQRSRSRRS